MCCCDKNETLGLLQPIGLSPDWAWNWDDPPSQPGGGPIYGTPEPMPLIAQQAAGPIAIAAAPAGIVAPAAAVEEDPINATTILIVIGILGAVFFATR
jgi:hypothetical protein